MKKILLLMLLFTAFTHYVSGQWSTDPAVNNVISDLSGEQALPKVAICPDGNIYIAFLSNQTGFYNVRLQKLDSQGNELWPHNGILISDNPTDSWVTDWDMTADISNHAVIAYNDTRNGNMNVYAYRIAPDGTFIWGADGIALSNNTAFNAAPKVTTTAAGNAIFAWTSDDVIIMQKVNPSGVKQWGTDGITLSSANSLSWPQLLPVGTDEFIMKYFDDQGSPPYPTRHVFAQKYNGSGSPVWSSPAVISQAGGIASWNQIFSFINDGNDGFYIAWHDDRDNNMLSSVFVHHIGPDGVPIFSANGIEASTAGGYNHFYPYLAHPAGSSEIYVFWNEMDGNQNYNGIFGQKISSAGARLWGNSGMTFIPLTLGTITPWAAQNSTTDMVVLYSEGSGNQQLKAMRIGTDGSFVWPSESITVSSYLSSKVHTVMSKYAADQWVVVWEDNRNDASDIYAQNFSIEGTLGPYEITFGSIQGHVTLTGGSGNITQVVVAAGNNSTFPDPTGDYFLQVPTGTYNVIASLAGYYPDTVYNVVVLEDQSTLNVDLELIAVPTTGYIEGNVTLLDGTGDVTQVLVSAGSVFTNPDATGYYMLEIGVGTWDVEATLEGYTPQMYSNVGVQPGLTTSDIDFSLSLLPTTGFLYGTVTIEGDMADVTQCSITVNNVVVNPDANGDYLIELPVGNFQVVASHPCTETENADVEITPGGSTEQDFLLMMLRRDMVCKVYDFYSNEPLIGAEVFITGPEEQYYGVLETDSIIFNQVPYGLYSGTAIFWGIGENDTIINQDNNLIEIWVVVGAASSKDYNQLSLNPNPVSNNERVSIITDKYHKGLLSVYDMTGRKLSEIYLDLSNERNFPVSLLFDGQSVEAGHYYIHFVSESEHFSAKLIITE